MRSTILAAATAATLLGGCATTGYGGGGYYADRYYRDDPRYTERVLTDNDMVYVGRDGR